MLKNVQAIKSLKEIAKVAYDIAQHRYPSFVYGQKLDGKEIPCFCLHAVEPESFERMLIYLKENNYDTLSINSYYRIMKGKEKLKNPKAPVRNMIIPYIIFLKPFLLIDKYLIAQNANMRKQIKKGIPITNIHMPVSW